MELGTAATSGMQMQEPPLHEGKRKIWKGDSNSRPLHCAPIDEGIFEGQQNIAMVAVLLLLFLLLLLFCFYYYFYYHYYYYYLK